MKKIAIFLLFSSFLSCSKRIYIADEIVTYNKIDSKHVDRSEDIDKLVAPYKIRLDSVMNEVIAFAPQELFKEKPNGTLGNWFTDVIKDAGSQFEDLSIDVSLQNYGGLRIPSIAKGEITVGKIYELMPFDNQLVVLTLDSTNMQQLFDRIADYGGWPISGSSFEIEAAVAKNIKIKDRPLTSKRTYQVALSDYIANGGDNCFFLKDLPRKSPNVLIRDLVIQYLKSQNDKTIIVDSSNRIKISEK